MKSAGTQMCSYNYIGDCASAIITVLINGKCGEAYNTANPDVRLTIAQLAEIIASAANRKVVFADPDDVDLAYRTPIAKQVLSSKKLENLGWSGVFSAEIGVKHTLDILLGKSGRAKIYMLEQLKIEVCEVYLDLVTKYIKYRLYRGTL